MALVRRKMPSPPTCDRRHILDLECDDRADVELALEFCIRVMRSRRRLVPELMSFVEAFEKLNEKDKVSSVGASSAATAGFAGSLASYFVAASWVNPVSAVVAGVGILGKNVAKHMVELDDKRLKQRLETLFRDDERLVNGLERHFQTLSRFPDLCFLHHPSESVSEFIAEFGRRDAHSARFWARKNSPDADGNIYYKDATAPREREPLNAFDDYVRLLVDAAGQLVVASVQEFGPRQAVLLVKSAVPAIADIMTNVAVDRSFKALVAHGAVSLGKEALLNIGVLEGINEVLRDSLSGKATEVMGKLGCNLNFEGDLLKNIVIDPTCNTQTCLDYFMDGLRNNTFKGFRNTVTNQITLEVVDVSKATEFTQHCAAKAAAVDCRVANMAKWGPRALGAVGVAITVYGIYLEVDNIATKLKQESREAFELRKIVREMEAALESRKITRVVKLTSDDNEIVAA